MNEIIEIEINSDDISHIPADVIAAGDRGIAQARAALGLAPAAMSSIRILESLSACAESREWAELPENAERTPRQLWETCERGDWLLWLAAKVGADRNLLTLAACDCARLALKFVPDGEDRPRLCIETTEAFLRGEATREQVRAAAYAAAAYAAAYAAARAAAYAAAAYAAYAAAYAADAAAYAAAGAAADAAADAAAYAAAYAAADAYAAARVGMLAACADLVRARIPWDLVEAALKLKGCEL